MTQLNETNEVYLFKIKIVLIYFFSFSSIFLNSSAVITAPMIARTKQNKPTKNNNWSSIIMPS